MKEEHELLVPPKRVSPSTSGKIISVSNKMKDLGGWVERQQC